MMVLCPHKKKSRLACADGIYKLNQASTYSSTQLPMQYHRLSGA